MRMLVLAAAWGARIIRRLVGSTSPDGDGFSAIVAAWPAEVLAATRLIVLSLLLVHVPS
jgi:hypothetical protein